MNRIALIKLFDRTAGGPLIRVLTRLPVAPVQQPKNLLIIRPGGMGDAVLLIPALRAFKQAHPDARITILAEQRNAAVFGLTDAVSNVLLYHKPAELVAALKGRYDAVIDTEQWHRLSAVVARLVRAPVSIGFGTNERKKMFSHPVAYSHSDHETDSFFRLLEPLGLAMPRLVNVPFLTVPTEAASRRQELLTPLSGAPYIVLFPGATIPEKRWPVEKYHELAAHLHSREISIVTVGGRGEVDDAAQIAARGVNIAGRTTLAETAAIIEKAQAVITGDSGLLHVAYGLGTPTVSLFGPSNVAKWAPRGERHLVLHHNLPCSPCSRFGYTPHCPSDTACMTAITVDEVAAAVLRLVGC